MRHSADLPGQYARSARQIAVAALLLDLVAIAMFFLTNLLGFRTFGIGVGFGGLALLVSIVGIGVSLRCQRPGPKGAIGTLILSIAIIGGYFFVAYQLAGLANMH